MEVRPTGPCSSKELTAQDYSRAEQFLPENAGKLAFGLEAVPNWIKDTVRFWYRVETRNGKRFILVDPEKNTRMEAFDHIRLAAALSRNLPKAYVHTALPFDEIQFVAEGKAIEFKVESGRWKCDLGTYELESVPAEEEKYDEVRSPDGKWAAFVRDWDIFLRTTGTGEETRLTEDGRPGCHYASPTPSPIVSAGLVTGERASMWLRPSITWSPDSKKILTYKIDTTKAKYCYLLQSVPLDGSKRPKMYPYVYGLPGDKECALAFPVILDVQKCSTVKADVEPLEMLYYGAPRAWTHWTGGDKPRVFYLQRKRGLRGMRLLVVDPETGSSKVLIDEDDVPGGDQIFINILGDGKEVLWLSQRDGWAHMYLYDAETGQVKNRVTSGPWLVREVVKVDEINRVVYFTAGGREEGRDPYYRHLYRVNLDGTDLKLLTPEDAEHQIYMSLDCRYFVDTYSRVDLPPVTVLRDNGGGQVMRLEEADIEILLATGWKFPERFQVKARDGITDIYGVIYRPTNFDPNVTYPVIEGNYSGPQTIRTPKAFGGGVSAWRNFWHDQALAELGFIVICVDGLGMCFRSKAFMDFAYKNLGDGGFPDHIAAFRQLANRYPYMDLDRVGIYGASAGGYASARAILAYPDFYKVSVVWAGNHDHRIDKAGWVERYMSPKMGPHYEEQANPTLAKNLKGKLLIMHGDMDENVPPAASVQLVDALIKENKDFDYLVIPNGIHASGVHSYVVRRRWDYFMKHLLGAVPPKEYRMLTGFSN